MYNLATCDVIKRTKQCLHCDAASIDLFTVCTTFNLKAIEYIDEAITEHQSFGLIISDAMGGPWQLRYQWNPENHHDHNIQIAKNLWGNGGLFLKDGVNAEGEVNFRVNTISPVYTEILRLMSKCDMNIIHCGKMSTLHKQWAQLESIVSSLAYLVKSEEGIGQTIELCPDLANWEHCCRLLYGLLDWLILSSGVYEGIIIQIIIIHELGKLPNITCTIYYVWDNVIASSLMGDLQQGYSSGLHFTLIPLLSMVERVVGVGNLPVLSYRPIMSSGGGVSKPSRLVNSIYHFPDNRASPPDHIIRIMDGDAIGSKISCNVGHDNLVGEFTNPGHRAILEGNCCCTVQQSSVLPRYQEESHETLHPNHLVMAQLRDESKALHEEASLNLSSRGGIQLRILIMGVDIGSKSG
ncbi:hypothetical protein OG21DRAFT_1524149 [Imleria badia]|nr:hypothetical protein OG21DRAFT_1524149 [Imleria badia]